MQVPDTKVAEIVDGELVVSPRPASPHAFAASAIGADVGDFHGDPGGLRARRGGWWILVEPELHLGDDVVVPDWAGWRQERLPAFPSVPHFDVAPDWACEVVSPSTGRIDRSRKMGIYARESIAHLWLVDPLAKTVEVYRLENGRWTVLTVVGGDEIVALEPFDAVELELQRWWAPAAPGL